MAVALALLLTPEIAARGILSTAIRSALRRRDTSTTATSRIMVRSTRERLASVIVDNNVTVQFASVFGQIHIHLTKNLPVASGIGGGTSDAAATIAALLEYHQVSLTPKEEDSLILASGVLGADVPMSLAHQFGRGPLLWIDSSGRESLPLSMDQKLPGVLVLANPGVPISTATVFNKVQSPYTACQDFRKIFEDGYQGNMLEYLKAQTNDLMTLAIAQEPVIGNLIETLQAVPGCLFARMSGTGATCFALFKNEVSARKACAALEAQYPQGWQAHCTVF